MTPLSEMDRLANLGGLVLLALSGGAFYRLIQWIRYLPLSPDPWDQLTTTALDSDEFEAVCHKCGQPHPTETRFCENCGGALGCYNNWMPYVYIFSEGEVLRTGATGKFRVTALTVGGYVIYSLIAYLIFAPVYWYFLFRNIRRLKAEQASAATNESVPGQRFNG